MNLEEHDTGHGKEIYKQVECCYALGDCCANMELPLPALAQVRMLANKPLPVHLRLRCNQPLPALIW